MRRRKTAIFFLVLGISLSALAVALNVGWILLNLREVVLMVLGIVFFATGFALHGAGAVRHRNRIAELGQVGAAMQQEIARLKLDAT